MNYFKSAVIVTVTLMLLACSSTPKQVEERRGKDSRYDNSIGTGKLGGSGRVALDVPPDLLATANDKVRENLGAAEDGSVTVTNTVTGTVTSGNVGTVSTVGTVSNVLPRVIGATIESDGAQTWLEVDADAEIVWRKLTEFWAMEDVTLTVLEPESGLMETDWFAKKSNSGAGLGSVAAGLLDTLRRTALDKFTVRLQRADGGTRVFITHRRREKISKEPSNTRETIIFEWVEREADAEKVAQLMQAMVVLFGKPA